MISSLPAAVKAAQDAETVLAEMNLPRWADTFHCTVSDIQAEWERQEWKRTQQAQNNCEVPDGK
jgi:hypothetical protein